MALQLAYYKLERKPCATYETGHTRLFFHGRTDTIRTCSVESKAFTGISCVLQFKFAETMTDPRATAEQKKQALVQAIEAHKAFLSDVVQGKGVDR